MGSPSTHLGPSPRVDEETVSPVVDDGHRETAQKVEETQEPHVEKDKPSTHLEPTPRVDKETVSPVVGDGPRGTSQKVETSPIVDRQKSGRKNKKKGNLNGGMDETQSVSLVHAENMHLSVAQRHQGIAAARKQARSSNEGRKQARGSKEDTASAAP